MKTQQKNKFITLKIAVPITIKNIKSALNLNLKSIKNKFEKKTNTDYPN
jgi:hypothetical protein